MLSLTASSTSSPPSAVTAAARDCCAPGAVAPEVQRTLRKLLSNIAESPHDDQKVRRLRTTNARIAAMLAVPPCRRLFDAIGFVPEDPEKATTTTAASPLPGDAAASAEPYIEPYIVLPPTAEATAATREALAYLISPPPPPPPPPPPLLAASSSSSSFSSSATPLSVHQRPSSCALCGRGCREHGWPPRGMM